MADYYVHPSGGSDSNGGTGTSDAKQTVSAGLAPCTTTWPVDGREGDVTKEEIAEARPLAARLNRLRLIEQRMAAWQNDKLFPAMADPSRPEPTADDLKRYLETP